MSTPRRRRRKVICGTRGQRVPVDWGFCRCLPLTSTPMSTGLTKPAQPLDKIVRLSNVPITQHDGPAPRANCPCGSGRPARRCHRGEDGSWIAKRPPALLTDERTGYANPRCYGSASKDCSEDMTREHYISDDV